MSSLRRVIEAAPSTVFSVCSQSDLELSRQQQSLRWLQQTKTTGRTDLFLCLYDQLMRWCEIEAISNGYRFGDHPHQAMKIVVCSLLATIKPSDVAVITDQRHRCKKQREIPKAEALEALKSLLQQVQAQSSHRSP